MGVRFRGFGYARDVLFFYVGEIAWGSGVLGIWGC